MSRGGDQSERMFQWIAKHFNERIIIIVLLFVMLLGPPDGMMFEDKREE